jgi:hypothetical protein
MTYSGTGLGQPDVVPRPCCSPSYSCSVQPPCLCFDSQPQYLCFAPAINLLLHRVSQSQAQPHSSPPFLNLQSSHHVSPYSLLIHMVSGHPYNIVDRYNNRLLHAVGYHLHTVTGASCQVQPLLHLSGGEVQYNITAMPVHRIFWHAHETTQHSI